MTNLEKIKSMDINEMAEFLCSIQLYEDFDMTEYIFLSGEKFLKWDFNEQVFDWLNSECNMNGRNA